MLMTRMNIIELFIYVALSLVPSLWFFGSYSWRIDGLARLDDGLA